MKLDTQQTTCKKWQFGSHYFDSRTIDTLSVAFKRHGYVRLPNFFKAPTFIDIKNELNRLAAFALSRDLTMEEFKTPRIMHTLAGQQIKSLSPFFVDLYHDPVLRKIVSGIVGQPVHDSHDETEWTVGTVLKGEGQTHGFHLDDPPIALIIIVEAPPQQLGGVLEMITDWQEIATIFDTAPDGEVGPIVQKLRGLGMIQTKVHQATDAYLLRADRCLHAVAPLKGAKTRRAIVNMAFELSPNIIRQSKTADTLFAAN
jgi:hypothetical protein